MLVRFCSRPDIHVLTCEGRSGFALQAWIEQASIGAGPLFRSINAPVSLVELPARPDVVPREPATRVRMLYLQVSSRALTVDST
jgi:hypothetical protein